MNELTAGIELDKLIATKVMGQIFERECPLSPASIPCAGQYSNQPEWYNGCLPRYSTDIAAAWLVAEVFAKHFDFSLDYRGVGWRATIYSDELAIKVYGDLQPTPALAVCSMALLAVLTIDLKHGWVKFLHPKRD